MKIFLFLFLTSILFASSYPYFTDSELEKIATKNSMAKNRIDDYENKVQIWKAMPTNQQIPRVNAYLNRLLPQYDDVIQKEVDNWATPKEFLTIGFGDCEDYAIIKYYTLIKLGIDEEKLFITIVKEKFYGGDHMVLSYFQEENQAPVILDNLSFKILDLNKRVDLKALYFINSTGVYKIDDKFKLTRVSEHHKKYEELTSKIKKNL